MKRRKPHYDRENNKCKKKMHTTFHFEKKLFTSQAQRPAQFPSQVFLADWRKLR